MLKGSTRFLIRPLPRLKEAAQRKYEEPGDVVYIVGKHDVDRAEFVKSLRRGDIAKVSHLHVLAEPKTRRHPKDPIADLDETMAAICKIGAVIFEASTMRRSDDACGVKQMVLDAVKGIRSGKRGGVKEGAGRPKNSFTPEQIDQFEREWFSKKHANRQDMTKAIKAAWVAKYGRKEAARINLTAVRRALQRAGKI